MKNTIQIPARLREVLERDRQLHGCVILTLNAFEPWLKSSGMPFFPEYTDHGPQHVEDTLLTAEALITDEAYTTITPADVAALALSVLIHDCAMHLDEEGFVTLAAGETESHLIDGFQDPPWRVLWLQFMGKASRFDGRELLGLFGDTEPVHRPSLDPSSMTRRDRLLIGEFLRRHHHRLAHEIALFGVPSGTLDQLRFIEVPDYLSAIAGVLARSHGLPIRRCVDILRQNDHHREYRGTHASFLMGVLRIADYLQVQRERAPQELLHVKHLQSPASQKEWNAHAAIVDIRHTHEDPEALFIEAKPLNVEIYLQVQDWLMGIQREMDESWAILGEVYGRYKSLSKLGFVLRRVRSNLDNTAKFAKTVEYVPRCAAFQAANPDLLKLLVGPLYGDQVDIAFRELVQNAVDAVRELRAYSPTGKARTARRQKTGPDVAVTMEKEGENQWWLTVRDHGIGMSLETVLEYFLKVGASYRRSDSWRTHFEDDSGRARVLRSGRFGIGVLASFMLGDKIQVSTRHVDSSPSNGLSFATSLDEDHIEIRRVPLPVGTTIRVRVAKSLSRTMDEWFHQRPWGTTKARDMYCLRDPAVERIVQPGGSKLKQPFIIPSPGETMPPDWGVIKHPDYEEVHWSYSKAPSLACNGIIVAEEKRYEMDEIWDVWWQKWKDEPFEPPNVSVFDPDGKLPLVLQRNSIARTPCPFASVLLEDVIKDFIAFLLVRGPTRFSLKALSPTCQSYSSYPGLKGAKRVSQWFLAESGFGPMVSQNLIDAGIKRLFLFANPSFADPQRPHLAVREEDALISIFSPTYAPKTRGIDEWLRFVFLTAVDYGDWSSNYPLKQLTQIGVKSRSVVLRMELVERYDHLKKKPLPMSVDRTISRPWQSDTWGSLCVNNASKLHPLLIAWAEAHPDLEYSGGGNALALWDFELKQDKIQEIEFNRIWGEVVGVPIIPYDPKTRAKALAHSFRALAPYVRRHKALAEKQSKKHGESRKSVL